MLVASVVVQACGGVAVGGRPTAEGSGTALLVVITVDQLSSDYLERYGGTFTHGFRRLLDEGAVWPRGVHDHAITETAPGHASILSGRFPVHTGISSNSQGVNTTEAPLLGATSLGASPFRFRGTAFYDWMRAADASSRALSVSRKDRGAILPIGRAKTDVYWYASNGTFTTSTYYRDALPGWVNDFNQRRAPQALAGREWPLLLESPLRYPAPDSVPREADGADVVFPHRLSTDPARAAAQLVEYPWMDSLTLAFALDGVRELALGTSNRRLDLLAVSLSTTDAVGHRYGPDSREIHDQLLRLDGYLGTFLDSLASLRGSEKLLVVLTADHGIAPYPDLRSSYYDNMLAQRVDFSRALSWVRRAMQRDGVDSMAVIYDDGFRVVDPDAFQRTGRDPDTYAQMWVEEMRRFNGVQRADMVSSLVTADTVQDRVARRWLHMFGPDDAVRAVVTLTPFSYNASVTYATHGSPHEYDARVPIIFWGAGIPAGIRPGEARVVDIAPTLAVHLGIRARERLDGRPLPLIPED
ncbi:MAG: alkaline phosphatase family protein [Gemmatimonadaceae bacterium]|nr:alkaline phosphatase family protein [Gemmatimonadaceae bacterium]